MGKDKIKILKLFFILIFSSAIILSCEPETDGAGNGTGGVENEVNDNYGNIVFEFPLPKSGVPESKIHRVDLSIAVDPHSLYSGYFIKSANVSDVLSSYSFRLEDGEYYFQAGITCSAAGDTCLWGGFPGGQWGTKWTSGKIEIEKGKTFYKNLTFNN